MIFSMHPVCRQLLAVATLSLGFCSVAQAQFVVPGVMDINGPPPVGIDVGCGTLDIQAAGVLNMNDALVDNTGLISIAAGGVLNGGTGIINVGGSWANGGTFNAQGGTVVIGDFCALPLPGPQIPGPTVLTGQTTFNNLTFQSGTGRTIVIPAGQNIIVNGTLTLTGAPGLPINFVSSNGGPAFVTLGPAGVLVNNMANLGPNVFIGPPLAAATVPTLGELGLLLLALLVAGLGVRQRGALLRRRD
jgi:hypothetical protein